MSNAASRIMKLVKFGIHTETFKFVGGGEHIISDDVVMSIDDIEFLRHETGKYKTVHEVKDRLTEFLGDKADIVEIGLSGDPLKRLLFMHNEWPGIRKTMISKNGDF